MLSSWKRYPKFVARLGSAAIKSRRDYKARLGNFCFPVFGPLFGSGIGNTAYGVSSKRNGWRNFKRFYVVVCQW